MNVNPDSEREDRLLDAVLDDEGWKTANSVFKRQALEVFRARQRFRWVARLAGGALTLGAMIAFVVYWAGNLPEAPTRVTLVPPNEIPKPSPIRYLTDRELLASFPKDSCFIAEVDGKKELVFLDAKLEQEYMGRVSSGTSNRRQPSGEANP